jgi:hypothetical protein
MSIDDEFKNKLFRFAKIDFSHNDLKSVNEEFFETFLKFCLETEDNLNAVKYIEYGKVYQKWRQGKHTELTVLPKRKHRFLILENKIGTDTLK